METTREGDAGYPEEQPPEVVPEDAGPPDESAVRESARPSKEAERAPHHEDHTATGNPNAAGSSEH